MASVTESRITTPPRVTASPGAYTVAWSLEGLEVEFRADRLRVHSDGTTKALVGIAATPAGEAPLKLSGCNLLNLTSPQTRRGLSRDLERRFKHEGLHWDSIIEASCRIILEREERGYEVQRLAVTDRLSPEYLVESVVLDGVANLVFAPGGSGKSYLGSYLALLCENGLTLGLQPGRQVNTLYLDFETSQQETARRCTLLAAGLEQRLVGSSITFPLYGRGIGTLADRTADIARAVAEHNIGLVIVDSAGAAAGGDILSAETAVRFFEAVRVATAPTNAASLIFSHVTKTDSRQDDAHRAPVGSVFFTNLSRLVWELRPQDTNREEVLQVGLFCRKANSGRPAPLGFRFAFQPNAVIVDCCGTQDVATEAGILQALMMAELERGPAKVADLMEATGATDSAVRTALTRLKQAGRAANPERGVWIITGKGERA